MTRYRHFGCGRSLRPERRSGFALILVLVAIAMVSLAAYTMTDRLVVENESAQLYGQQLQARMAVDSGVSHVLFLLEQPVPTRLEWGGVYDNPTMFQAQLVVDHPEPRGRVRFGVVAPRLDAQGLSNGWRWGLEDESARININALEMQETVGAAAGAIADAAMGALPQAIAGGGGVPVGNTQGGPQGGSQPSGGNRSGGGGAAGGANTQAPTGQPQPTAPNAQGNSNGNAPRPGDSNGAQGGGSSGAAPSGAGAPSDSSNAGDSSTEDAVEAIDTSGRTLLMKLPGMTEDVADAILDWIDADDEPREFGAEIDFYSSMQPAYAPRNGPLETIEELLLVRGVTPDLLFGRDVNRNGMLDVAEQSLPSSSADDGTGAMDLGWASMLTVYSQERNVNQQGQRRIDLNGVSDMQQLYDDLVAAGMDESWATFIVAYRQRGPYQGTSTQTVTASNVQLDMTQQGTNELTQVLDLIDAKVEIPAQNGGQASVMESPFSSGLGAMSSYMSKLMDLCTVRPEKVFAGRVNINQASRTVLLTVPGITPEIAESIINQRDMQGAENAAEMANETWILARGIVTLAEMRQIQPFITARGDVYRGQVVGYYDSGEIASRVEVIFDASSAVPRLLSWRDISHLGRGFARETLGVSGMSVSGNTDGLGSGSSLSSGR